MADTPWYELVRIGLYVLWFVIAALVVKLLIVRGRWRHPLRENSPMLVAILLMVVSVEISRARNISDAPPPYTPPLLINIVVTLLIGYWLWQQMELIPRWLRTHLRIRRRRRNVAAGARRAASGVDDTGRHHTQKENPMALSTGDRVSQNGKEGSVVGAQRDDETVTVSRPGGGSAVVPVEDVELVEPETKQWPPTGVETK